MAAGSEFLFDRTMAALFELLEPQDWLFALLQKLPYFLRQPQKLLSHCVQRLRTLARQSFGRTAMPDAYLHHRTALRAARLADYTPACPAAFLAGANGPDPLFAYGVFAGKPAAGSTPGHQMHSKQTLALLTALLAGAHTPAQCSFAAGFLTHAALDTALHPYIAFLAQTQGSPYAAPGGHCRFEAALDTVYYRYDTGRRFGAAPPDLLCPRLLPDELADICALLRDALKSVYGLDAEVVELSDCCHRFRLAHWFFYSPLGGKKLTAKLADLVMRTPGNVSGHMQPRALAKSLPVFQAENGPVTCAGDLLPHAEQTAADLISAAKSVFRGELSPGDAAAKLGNVDWMTHLPCD